MRERNPADVLADKTLATAHRDWLLSTTASPIHYEPMALAFEAGWKAALQQSGPPVPSDALKIAATNLLADVRRRYPDEELRCEYMIALDAALKDNSNG